MNKVEVEVEAETGNSGVVVELKFVELLTPGIERIEKLTINVEFMKVLLTGIVVVTIYIVVDHSE